MSIENGPGLISVGEQIKSVLSKRTPEEIAAAHEYTRKLAESIYQKRGGGDSTPEQKERDWQIGEVILVASKKGP